MKIVFKKKKNETNLLALITLFSVAAFGGGKGPVKILVFIFICANGLRGPVWGL